LKRCQIVSFLDRKNLPPTPKTKKKKPKKNKTKKKKKKKKTTGKKTPPPPPQTKIEHCNQKKVTNSMQDRGEGEGRGRKKGKRAEASSFTKRPWSMTARFCDVAQFYGAMPAGRC